MSAELTQERLKEILWYHPETGVFRWRSARANLNRKPWDEAGSLNPRGYIHIFIGQKSYKAHRLAWLYMTGTYPTESIDHKNRVKSDNRWENLRLADAMHNQWNAGRRVDNTSGVKGVHYSKKDRRWVASCWVGKTRYYLGGFKSVEAAAQAVQKFRSDHHGEFTRH